jgi:hypothetical protein
MGITRHGVAAFISPKIPEITKSVCVDVAQEFSDRESWLATFFLKVAFQNHAAPDKRALCVQLLRRAECALAEYSAACEEFGRVPRGSGANWSSYFKALYRLEATVTQSYQFFDYARKALDTKLFEKGDGSSVEHLNIVYNASKHGVATTDQPVWLTDDGIACDDATLSFLELESLLRQVGRIATRLVEGP